MHYEQSHESVRRQLQVGADGVVSAVKGERQSALELARCLSDQGNLFRRLPAAKMIAACKPLPERLLLFYALQAASERTHFAWFDALVAAFFALFPAALAFILVVDSTSGPYMPAALVGTGIVAAAATWAYVRNMMKVGEVWEYSEWIDFTSRTWNSRRHFNDGAFPDVVQQFPLDSLALVCSRESDEGAAAFDVAISRREDIAAAGEYYPHFLTTIHLPASQALGVAFGNEIAALWGIECFYLAPT